MRKIFILTAVGFASAALLPISASYASPVTSDTSSAALDIFARRGAGEPGDVRGEGAGHPVKAQDESFTVARRGRGADDPKGHIRGEGAGHPVKSATPDVAII